MCSESFQGTTFRRTRTARSVSNHMKMFSSLTLVTAFSAILAGGCSKSVSSSMLGDAAHPTPVHVYTVAEETAKRRVQASGSLFALEESILSAQVEGRVSQVLADVGDNVKEGQPLILIDPQELAI